jgi:hypothetical protein
MNKHCLALGVLFLSGCAASKSEIALPSKASAKSVAVKKSPYTGTWASPHLGEKRVKVTFTFAENQKCYMDASVNGKPAIGTLPGTYVLDGERAIVTVKLVNINKRIKNYDSTDTYRITPKDGGKHLYLELIYTKFIGTDGKRYEVNNEKVGGLLCTMSRIG